MPVVPKQSTQEAASRAQENSIVVPLNSAYPVIVQYFKPEGLEVRIVCAEKLNAGKLNAAMVKVLKTLRVEKHKFAMEQTALKTGESKWQQTQEGPQTAPAQESNQQVQAEAPKTSA